MEQQLLINQPLRLVERLFGPDKPVVGRWVKLHEFASPIFVYEEEELEDAVDAEGELRP
jgi:hypothetical protein